MFIVQVLSSTSIFPCVSMHICSSLSLILVKLVNSKTCTKATDWPVFLYDPANADGEKGLFTNDLLFSVCHSACFCVSFLNVAYLISRCSIQLSLERALLSLGVPQKLGC